jgi:hypothetical protein
MDTVTLSLDSSGSMLPFKKATVGTVNEYIDNIKDLDVNFKLVNWDSTGYRILYQGHIRACPRFTESAYIVGSLTPLMDAFGKGLTDLMKIEDGKKMLVLFTDGQENDSKEYNFNDVKLLVNKFIELGNEIIFLGANIDAWDISRQIDVKKQSTHSFRIEDQGEVYKGVSVETRSYFTSTGTTSTGNNTDGE